MNQAIGCTGELKDFYKIFQYQNCWFLNIFCVTRKRRFSITQFNNYFHQQIENNLVKVTLGELHVL